MNFNQLNTTIGAVVDEIRDFANPMGGTTIVALPDGPEKVVLLLALMQVTAVLPVHPAIAKDPLSALIQTGNVTAIIGANRPSSEAWRVAEAHNLTYIIVGHEDSKFCGFSFQVVRSKTAARAPLLTIDDTALCIATSGTTGSSKIIAITQRSLDRNVETHGRMNNYGPGTRALCVMPFNYLFAYVRSALPMIRMGGAVGIAPGYRFRDMKIWCDKLRPTCMTATPTILKKLLADARAENWRPDKGVLTRFHSTGEAISDTLAADIAAVFDAELGTNYGMTEASPQIAVSAPEDKLPPGVAGRIVPPWEVSILDDNGKSLPTNGIGRVAVKGGYVNSIIGAGPDARFDEQGRLLTGDRGFLDHASVLHLAGRVDDVINRGGEKIDPKLIETAIEKDPDIDRAVVFGMPDEALGQKVWAIIKLRNGSGRDLSQVRKSISADVAGWGMPEMFIEVTEIPTTANGKVSRNSLTRHYVDNPPARAGV